MGFFIQMYDKNGVVIGHSRKESLDAIGELYKDMLVLKGDRATHWVKLFQEGDPEPLVYAYKNGCAMNTLLAAIPPSDLMH